MRGGKREVLGDVCPRCFADLREPGGLYLYEMKDGRTLRQCANCRKKRSRKYEAERRKGLSPGIRKYVRKGPYKADPSDPDVKRAMQERKRVLRERKKNGPGWYKRAA